MFKSSHSREYLGRLLDTDGLRDNPYLFSCLNVKQRVAVHSGCVNTVNWDDSGEYLLTGSDDRHICLTPMFSSPNNDPLDKPVFSQRLPANSNVFTAKFLPATANTQVLVGFKCGCLLHVRLDVDQSSNVEPVFCHKYAVYDVLTFTDLQTCFLSLSHDQSVVCFDTRVPYCFSQSSSTCNQRCSYPMPRSPTVANKPTAGIASMRFEFPVTAGDVHPLAGSRCVALASADGFVRLFDLRRFVRSGSPSPIGESTHLEPFRVVRPLGLPAKCSKHETIRLDYGPAHITSVQFEPIYAVCPNHFCANPNRSGTGARHLLVSHMYAPVFLFDLNNTESAPDPTPETIPWLPNPDTSEHLNTDDANGETTSQRTRNPFNTDPAVQIALALICWIERQRSRAQNPGNPSGDNSPDATEDERTHGHATATETNDSGEQSGSESRSSPLDRLTDEYVAKVLRSAPRLRQVMDYKGRRSCRTVIKTAVFWGRDYILSGSECGNVIAWNRHSGQPLSSIQADSVVVNRIAPHPRLPIFASSGIDSTVKIIKPDPRVYEGDEDDDDNDEPDRCYRNVVKCQIALTADLCEENSDAMLEALRSGSLHLNRLARLGAGRALRTAIRRLTSSRRSAEDQESSE